MNFIKNVLRHRWFVAIVVLLAVGFVFRGTLFPGLFGEAQSPAIATGPQSTTSTESGQQGRGGADEGSAEPGKQSQGEAKGDAVAGAQPDDQGPAEAGRPGERARAGGQAQQPPRGAPATGRGSGQTTGDRGGAQASKGEGGSGKAAESHQSARYAYWSGRFQEAERIYQELAEANPENPDFPGELGNVFYAQGQWQKAANAYTRAALRLIEQGDYPRAHHLYRIVHGLDREKAAEIRDKLGQARKTSGG